MRPRMVANGVVIVGTVLSLVLIYRVIGMWQDVSLCHNAFVYYTSGPQCAATFSNFDALSVITLVVAAVTASAATLLWRRS